MLSLVSEIARFLGSAMGIAIANRKNRCDFGALRLQRFSLIRWLKKAVRKRAEYCFESAVSRVLFQKRELTVSSAKKTQWVRSGTNNRLRGARQVLSRKSARNKKLTEFPEGPRAQKNVSVEWLFWPITQGLMFFSPYFVFLRLKFSISIGKFQLSIGFSISEIFNVDCFFPSLPSQLCQSPR